MDPLSITVAVASLVKICGSVGWEIKKFIDGAKSASSVVGILLQKVEAFQKTLESLNGILDDPRIKASVHYTGDVGTHWINIKTCLDDAQVTLDKLQITITKVNKTVSVLDSARRHRRIQSSSDTIKLYQQQIQSYKDTINVSLQTAIL
jgi:Fungal N-terminal domain of STAND proteins